MIRNLVIKIEATEPAIGKGELHHLRSRLHLLQPALRIDYLGRIDQRGRR
jgi:hypothetical protein